MNATTTCKNSKELKLNKNFNKYDEEAFTIPLLRKRRILI